MARLGVVFPQTEADSDVSAIREFVQSADDLGFDYITVYDHVLGADPGGRGSTWVGAYTHEDAFHEPLVLLGFMAAITKQITFATGVLVLPQRQTALVAKQAAEIDRLSAGRLRLAVGVGWNSVEFEALGETFSDRGARLEEQIEVLRALWTQPVVDFKGRWHRIDRAGINPLPVQQPIPIWTGGTSNRATERAGRLADGWLPGKGGMLTPFEQPDPRLELVESLVERRDRMWAAASEAGRDPKAIAIGWTINFSTTGFRSGRPPVPATGPDQLQDDAQHLEAIGVTHITIDTLGSGLSWPSGHIDALRQVKQLLP